VARFELTLAFIAEISNTLWKVEDQTHFALFLTPLVEIYKV
jgi:hypothetical protein